MGFFAASRGLHLPRNEMMSLMRPVTDRGSRRRDFLLIVKFEKRRKRYIMRKMGKRCIRGLFTTGLLAAGIFLYREELLAAPAEEGKIIAYANVSSCPNIRTGKGTEYEVKAQLPKDGCCEILEDAGDWCRISSDGIEGYVFKAYLITGISEKEYLALTQRREPVYAYRISEEKTNKADKIQTASAGVQNASKGEELVQFALQFVGNPYVWGGTSLTKGQTAPALSRVCIRISGFPCQEWRQY